MTVEEMKAVDIRTVHPEELVDITKLIIDKALEGDTQVEPGHWLVLEACQTPNREPKSFFLGHSI